MSVASLRVIRGMPVSAAVVLMAGWFAASGSIAEEASEQVWLISTRELADDCQATGAAPQYWRFGADQQWAPADEKAFLAADDAAVPTVFVIHGNRADCHEAVRQGHDVTECLKDEAPGRRFRLAIWSWPADRIPGRVRIDVQTKAARSERESYHLARLIDAMRPDVPVSLVGYSFGARTIGGTLNLLAGEPWAGQVLPGRKGKPPRALRVVLVAAALDDTALAPWGSHGCALGQIDQVLVTTNRADTALKWYPHMDRPRGPGAMGFLGPACPRPTGSEQKKLEVLDLSRQVGRNHTWVGYLAAPALRARLAEHVLLGRGPANSAASAAAPRALMTSAGASTPADAGRGPRQ